MPHRALPSILATLLALAPAALSQAPIERSAALREMNAEALRLHEDLATGRAVPRGFDQRAAAALLRSRGQALLELMREDPAEALKLALPAETAAGLRRTFPEAAPWLEETGEWSGEFESTILDDFEAGASTSESWLVQDGERTILHFSADAGEPAQCSTSLAVEGLRLAGNVAVRAVTGTSAAATCSTTGQQQTLVILVKFPGYPDKFTIEFARNAILGNTGTRSLNTYWQEVSAGRTSAAGTVIGWLTLDKVYSCTDYVNMRLAALKAADPLVDLTQFTRILILFPNPGSCSFGGISTVGCTTVTSSRGTSYASLSQLVADYVTTTDRAVQLSSHEAGHGLGLKHAASRDFGSEPLGPLASAGTLSTYGDNFDTMGYWNLGHYSAAQKQTLGWWAASNQIQTVQSGGTYTIAPAELALAGVQALKVQRGTGNNAWLWLEYRRPTGLFDNALPSQVFSGVLIHYEDSTNAGLTHLADFSPSSANWNGPALAAGSTWTDPYTNLSITVLSATSSAATVTVNYGAATCAPASPSLSVSPSTASVTAGLSVAYSVSLRNNDSSACAPSSFSLASVLPAGWTGSASPSALSLSPGQSVSATLAALPPASTATGTYQIAVRASDSARSLTATAGVNVTQPVAAPLSLALSSSTTSPTTKTKITFQVKATRNAVAQGGVPVTLMVTNPSGGRTSYALTTNSTGVASLALYLRTTGAYSIVASATDSGATVLSPSLSLTVR